MKREELKALLGDKADDAMIDKIMEMNGKDIEKHKGDAATEKQRADGLKTSLDEANKQIETFKDLKPEELQKAADDYKAKFEQSQKDKDAEIAALKFDHALGEALKGAKVKDPADVIPHLKRDMLKLGEDGKVIGLDDQLKPLKEAKAYLFAEEESTEETPEIITGGKTTGNFSLDKVAEAARMGAGLKPGDK